MLLRAASSSAILPNRLLQRLPVRAVSQRTMAASTPVSSGLPDKIEDLFAATAGNRFANINRPTAGAREERALPEGSAPVQLYSLATPNGVKVSIVLEELADAVGLQYDAWRINIGEGAQFTSGFVNMNPNSKIPSLVDKEGPDGKPICVWESASIALYLCKKHGKFIPKDPRLEVEMTNWIFWQMAGQGPMTGAGFGHFFAYAPMEKLEARQYGVARYGMEVQRLCSVLEQHLEGKTYLVGEEYTLADMMCFPWFNMLRSGGYKSHSGQTAGDFLSVSQYKNVNAWADRIAARPAVQRGMQVCIWTSENTKPWLDAAKP